MRPVVGILCGLALVLPAPAEEIRSPVGNQVEDFTLQDYRGKEWSLDDFKEKKLVVLAFLGTECPLAKLYGPRLAELAEKYQAQDVAFLGINSNQQDTLTEVAAYARIHKIDFPLLKDPANKVADRLGAVRTPEVFVLDPRRKVRYWGKIDDQYGIGYIRDEVAKPYLANALDQLLAGKEVATASVEAEGCYIGRVHRAKKDAEVTYSNQIARIFQNRCVECHRKGEIAPFALTDYKKVAGWAETIAEVVRDNRMPPWHADPKHGDFLNDRSLTQEEKQLIYDWVDAGVPEGDPKNLPEPRTYTTGWQLPKEPDVVFNITEKPVTVQATGAVRYKYYTVESNFKEDKWIKAAELLPGNRAVVHHILAFALPPGVKRIQGGTRGYLVGYVPGLRVRPFPKGMAKRIPAGSRLVFQVHYTPIGSEQEDQSRLGIVFADPRELTHEVRTTSVVNPLIRIPAGEADYKLTARNSRGLENARLLSFMPHMHLRGKSFRYIAHLPDGKEEILLDVPEYDFNWQTAYVLTKPRLLPKGTRIEGIAHFDNSEDNLNNPDPTKMVRWGDQTWDEMMIGYFDIAVPLEKGGRKAEEDGEVDPKIRQRAQQIIDLFDSNGDGKVKRDEVPERHLRGFDRLDKDKNGEIDVDELIRRFTR